MASGASKPIIIVVGNCQSSFVANFLKALPEVGQQFEVKRFRNFNEDLDGNDVSGGRPDDLPVFVRSNKGRIVAFLRQATHNWAGDPITRDDFAPETVFVEYPAAQITYLWPLAFRDDRFKKAPASVRRRIPYSLHDSLLRKLALDGVPEEDVVAAYMAHDITATFKLDRLRALNDAKMKQIDKMASFPIADYVAANVTDVQLFRTMNHPSGPLMAEIMRRILALLPFVTDQTAVQYRLEEAAGGPGIQDVDAPIHPQIVRHFGLSWAERDQYRFWDEGSYSFAEHLVRLYRMECNPKIAHALALLRTGDVEAARRLTEEAVSEVPRSAAWRAQLADICLRQEDLDGALTHFRTAWSIEPMLNPGIKFIRLLLRAGRSAEAKTVAAEFGRHFGTGTAAFGLVQGYVLHATEGSPAAVAWLRSVVASPARADYRVWLSLSSMLSATGDPHGARDAMEAAYTLSGMAPKLGVKLDALRARAAKKPPVAG